MSTELILNLVWLVVATAGVICWWRTSARAGSDLRAQVSALAMLVVLLFPIISITDDLWAAQNPAETDTVRRFDGKDHAVLVVPRNIVPLVLSAILMPPVVPAGYAPLTTRAMLLPVAPDPSSFFIRPPPSPLSSRG